MRQVFLIDKCHWSLGSLPVGTLRHNELIVGHIFFCTSLWNRSSVVKKYPLIKMRNRGLSGAVKETTEK